ncbi:MAG TPA: ATP-dependent DNA helicase [Epulopiscium sp.]|nr:ATP-dependent DNA helicase [Candidatus Epulonipiscium sp.]
MCARNKEPFEYKNKQEFKTNLVEWIGDVLYDLLPDCGYDVRDEQIFTAFQIADAFCDKKVHLAEAGLGTGKTFAYLLSAIPYARFTGKPVVIACATTALQEQLAGAGGDIRTLSQLLELNIDARMAKDPNQYICDVRANENIEELGGTSSQISAWLNKTKLGERSEIPTISDREWKKIKWEESMDCNICSSRGFCKLVKAREQYRLAKDLLIVDHKTYFYDLWTREERLASGQLPILPDYCAVIFDEGHKVLLPASMQAGQHINREEMDGMIATIEELQGARDSLLLITEIIEDASDAFFTQLEYSVIAGESPERMPIRRDEALLKAATTFHKILDQLLLEMQIEQELYTESLTPTQIQAYEGQIEKAIGALNEFCRNQGNHVVSWVNQKDGSFWVVPRKIGDLLNKQLFQKEIPVVFTSATLSNKGDFDYFIRTLDLKTPSSSTIGSPFDLENQVAVYLPEKVNKLEHLVTLLKENGGRALILTNSLREVKEIRKGLGAHDFPFEMIWEDKGERGYLVRKFREEESSVLIGANFWEGIDIPGESLTLVIIWDLPLKGHDPLIEVQRKDATEQGLDPVTTVDYPEMALKLKQGCGRLIRTEDDHGAIVILDPVKGTPWESYVMGALPSAH